MFSGIFRECFQVARFCPEARKWPASLRVWVVISVCIAALLPGSASFSHCERSRRYLQCICRSVRSSESYQVRHQQTRHSVWQADPSGILEDGSVQASWNDSPAKVVQSQALQGAKKVRWSAPISCTVDDKKQQLKLSLIILIIVIWVCLI